MSDEAITFYALKFFPHFGVHFGRLAVIAVLENRKRLNK